MAQDKGMRVYQLAKTLGVESKELLDFCKELGYDIKNQLSNLAAAESRIRDADLANEAANMTKAQVLLQAGVAALAQANSAPQQILSLLRG